MFHNYFVGIQPLPFQLITLELPVIMEEATVEVDFIEFLPDLEFDLSF